MKKIILLITLSLCQCMLMTASAVDTLRVGRSVPSVVPKLSTKLTIDLTIALRPIDFVNADYLSNTNCALANALKRQLKLHNGEASVGVTTANFYLGSDYPRVRYIIEGDGYTYGQFLSDARAAKEGGNRVIRIVRLTKYIQEDFSL